MIPASTFARRAPALWVVVFLFTGAALVVIFQHPYMAGARAAATAFWTLAALAFIALHNKNFALLSRLILILYCVTLIASLPLLAGGEAVFWRKPLSRLLSADPDVVQAMMLIAAVGLCGLTIGMIAGNSFISRAKPATRATPELPPFNMAVFTAILLVCIGLIAAAAPAQTILTAQYASEQSPALSASLRFNSAGLIGFTGLALAYIDATRTADATANLKKILFASASVFALFYFQILRGDRDGFTFVLAIAALYIVGPHMAQLNPGHKRDMLIRMSRLFVPLLLLVIFGIILGILRTEITTAGIGALTAERFVPALLYNTPTSVVVTLLGAAAYHANTGVEYLMGQSYLDLLLSLPPGLVTNLIGVERPFEAGNNPAWWFAGLSSGGIYMVVLPFLNFGIFALLPVMAAIGFIFGAIEGAMARGGVVARLFYAAAFCASAKYVWYGDLPLIRAMMTAGIIASAYHLIVFMRARYPASISAL